jgi:large subunit ribosomal protein L30
MAKKATVKEKRVRITLVKSPIGFTQRQKDTVRALGFHRMHETIEHIESPAVLGMIAKVIHLLEVEKVE